MITQEQIDTLREVLNDYDDEALLYKIDLRFDCQGRNVTIDFCSMDEQFFNELKGAAE